MFSPSPDFQYEQVDAPLNDGDSALLSPYHSILNYGSLRFPGNKLRP